MITYLTTNYIETESNSSVIGVAPDVFLVIGSDKTNEENFYFEIVLKIGNKILQKYKIVPNEGERAIINISRILRLHTIPQHMPVNDNYDTSPNTVIRAIVYEYFGGSLNDTEHLDISIYDAYYRDMTHYLSQGYNIKYPGNISYLRGDFVFADARLRLYNFLTLSLAKRVGGYEVSYYNVFATIGSTQKYTTLPPTSTIYTINLYNFLVNVLGFLPGQAINASNIRFSVSAVGANNTEDFVLAKSQNDQILIWKNELGGFSSLPIPIITYATDTTHKTYQKGITYIDSINDGARPAIVGVEQIEKIRIVSDWMDGNRAMEIYKSLMSSKETYIKFKDNAEPSPITVVPQNITHKSSEFDDLINVDITAIKNVYYV